MTSIISPALRTLHQAQVHHNPLQRDGTAAPWSRTVVEKRFDARPRAQMPGERLKSELNLHHHRAEEERLARAIQHQFRTNPLEGRYKPGKLIGAGTSKQAFELKGGKEVLLIRKMEGFDITQELVNLQKLKSYGIPTGAITEIGTYDGRQALVMKRYPVFQKLGLTATADGLDFVNHPLVNQNTADGLRYIRNRIKELGINILDFQFGITEKGDVAVLDPLGVVKNQGPFLSNRSLISTLDECIHRIEARCKPAPRA